MNNDKHIDSDPLIDCKNPELDEEVIEIAKDYDIDIEEAEEVKNLVDELGVDTDEAIEILESL